VEKVGNYLKKDLAKPGYKSKHERFVLLLGEKSIN
jgi:hypothetical protein